MKSKEAVKWLTNLIDDTGALRQRIMWMSTII